MIEHRMTHLVVADGNGLVDVVTNGLCFSLQGKEFLRRKVVLSLCDVRFDSPTP